MTTPPHTLIGGVGHPELQDISVGPVLSLKFAEEEWPQGTLVEDLSYGPVAVMHRFNDFDPPLRRVILFGAVRRERQAGALAAYRWDRALPEDEEIQDRVAEAVTGVIGLDNLLIVTTALGAMPAEVLVVEVEPAVEAMGTGFSPQVAPAVAELERRVRALALLAPGQAILPPAPIGGFTTSNGAPHAAVGAGK
ncbi:hypothetical protein BH20GEM2_BH20GEM2_03810 [soil metagenome]